MNQTISPVPTSERAEILDVLRGFAIFGIFLANSAGFSLYMFIDDSVKQTFNTYNSDVWLGYLLTALVDGKFYSLFSLLFGIGFTIILDRNEKAGRNPLRIFYRRLVILALLGLGHIFLLWEGDILLLYALVGMVLPLFRKFSNKSLLITSVCLILSPLLFDLAKVLSDGAWNLSAPIAKLALETDAKTGITEDNYRTYLVDNSTYQSILNWCQGGLYWRYEYIINSNRIPKVLAMFLVGMVVGRNMMYNNIDAHKKLLQKIQRWTLMIGIPCSIAFAYFEADHIFLPKPSGLLDTFFYAVSVIPLSLAYTTTICLMWLGPKGNKFLKIFAPVGRMALTNYILQTIAGVYIYYGIGMALGAKSGPTVYLPIAAGVFVLQLFFSALWLKYFNFGPLEWIWRTLTYGKYMQITRN